MPKPAPADAEGSTESARKRPSMLRSVASFSSMTMISRVFGLLRDMVISRVFGVSAATDAFWVAFRIPNFMRRLFAEGSFTTAFVPVFTEIKEKRSHADLKELVARTAGSLGAVLLVVKTRHRVRTAGGNGVLAGRDRASRQVRPDGRCYAHPPLYPVRVDDCFTAARSTASTASHAGAGSGVVEHLHDHLSLWLAPRLDTPILALAGDPDRRIIQFLCLPPDMAKLDLLALPRLGWPSGCAQGDDVDGADSVRLSIAQVNLLLDTVLASLLYVGSQSWLSQADRFLELPLGVAKHRAGHGDPANACASPCQHRSRRLLEIVGSACAHADDRGAGNVWLDVVVGATGRDPFQYGHYTPFDLMAALSVSA